MKIISKLSLGIATVATLFVVGCSTSKTYSEESLGLRKTNLYTEGAETAGEATKYGKAAAGSSKTISRAFQDAPPMIPHDVDGMLPITIKNNACIGCHAPEVAPSMGAKSYPVSHMTNFRPKSYAINGINTDDGNLKHISIKKEGRLVGARFNCSQCHAPQSEGQLVENTFEPVYTSKDGASASSWNGTKFMKGIDTTK